MYHLAVRVPWHDNRWNGAICAEPEHNSYCNILKNIVATPDATAEVPLAGKVWQRLSTRDLPPCHKENGGFMNVDSWRRTFNHPYRQTSPTTHGMLRETIVVVPTYTTFAVPFFWMQNDNEGRQLVQRFTHQPLPDDVHPPFSTHWIFGAERQRAISHLFFDDLLKAQESLIVFYTKKRSTRQ